MPLTEEELIQTGIDLTNQEIFNEAFDIDDDEDADVYDRSGDRSLEMSDRIDGQGQIDPQDEYEDASGRAPPSEAELDEEADNEKDALIEQLTRERNEARAAIDDRSRQQAAEQAEAGTQFVLNNPEQARDLINQGLQNSQRAWMATADANGYREFGSEAWDEANRIVAAAGAAAPEHVKAALRAELANSPRPHETIMDMAQRFQEGGQRSANLPPSLVGGVGSGRRAAPSQRWRSYEGDIGWTSTGPELGSDTDIWNSVLGG
jgi:hypothetical protein